MDENGVLIKKDSLAPPAQSVIDEFNF